MRNVLPNENSYVAIAKAAKILGVSIDTVRRWDAQGTLHSVRLDGKNRYFLKSELKNFRNNKPLTISEAAYELSVSASTLRRLEDRGVILSERGIKGERLYHPGKIREILASRKKGGQKFDLFSPSSGPPSTNALPPLSLEIERGGGIRGGVVLNEGRAPLRQGSAGASFWKKNHLLKHVGQFASFGHYSTPVGIKFGHTPPEYKKALGMLSLILLLSGGIFAFTVLRDFSKNPIPGVSFSNDASLNALARLSPKARADISRSQVLAATTTEGQFIVNIPALFTQDITVDNKNLDLGTGEITASNVVYSIGDTSGDIALGTGLTISGNTLSTDIEEQDTFSTAAVGSTNITAASPTDKLTFAAGTNITLSADTSTKKITITGASFPAQYWTLSGSSLYPTSTSYSVGIGNTSPSFNLDVTGTFRVTGASTLTGAATFGSTTSLNSITYTWPATQSDTYVLQTNGSGTLSWVTPSGAGFGTNYWSLGTGTIYPTNVSLDFLLGNSATTSAKFAVINVNSGTPTASLSAGSTGGAYLTAAGTLQTTANQGLTIGGNTTGDITLSPLSGSGTTLSTGVLNLSTGKAYQIAGTEVLSATTLGTGVVTSSLTTVGALASGSIATGFGTISTGNTITTTSTLTGGTVNASTGTIQIGGTNVLSSTILGTGVVTSSLTTVGALASGSIATGFGTISTGNTITTTSTLTGGTVNSTGAVQTGGTDRITSTGNLTGIGTTQLNSITYTWPSSQTASYILQTNGTGTLSWVDATGGGIGTNYWSLGTGTIYPTNVSLDLLVGNSATTSAKFAVINVNSGTPTATLSAGSAGGAYINATGTIQTTANQGITIGGNTTGNITLSPLNGSGTVTVSGTTTLNSIAYTWPSSQTASYILQTNGTGTLSWVDATGGGIGTNYWSLGTGTIYPTNVSLDLLVGNSATTSAKFAVINVNSGTPTATLSAGSAGGAYINATGTLSTTAGQTLTLGTTTTGSINIGTDATARAITIGNATIASQVAINTGATTQDVLTITAASLSSGTAIAATGHSTTGVTDHFVKLTSDVGSAAALIYGAPDFSGSTVTGYGLNITATDSTTNSNTDYAIYGSLALSGAIAKTGYGAYTTVTSSSTTGDTLYSIYAAQSVTGAITLTDTRNQYGVYSAPANTATNTGGTTNIYGTYSAPSYAASADVTGSTVNVYGNYISTTGTLNTAGTINQYGAYIADGSSATTGASTKYGLYVADQSGADTNYEAIIVGTGGVGIGDTTPDAVLDIDAATTTTAAFGLTDTGVHTGTGTTAVATIVANSATTGDVVSLSATGMTTGEALDITGTWAPTAGGTIEAFDINITHSPTGSTDNFRSIDLDTTDGTALGSTIYGIDATLTLTGDAAKSGVGIISTVTSSSATADALTGIEADTTVTGIITTGTRSIYGFYSAPTSGAESTGGTTNVYGLFTAVSADVAAGGTVNAYGVYISNGTYDTDGTSTAIGLYLQPLSGADNNYGICFDCDGTWSSSTVASGIQFGNDANGVTLYRSASDVLRTGDGLTVDLDLIVSGGDITGTGDEGIDIGEATTNGITLLIDATAEVLLTSAALSPSTSDGNALGTSSLMWADLFLASGGVINFNNGDVTLTHAADALTIGGGAVTISGSAEGTAALTLTAGDLVITDGDLTLSGGEISATTDDTTTTGFAYVANTITSGNGITLSATGMTTGEALDITGTWAPTDASTNEAIDINITHTSATLADNFRSIDLDTSDGTALTNTVYNIDATLTLTGNAAKVGYGIYSTVTSSSTTADTLYGGYFTTNATGNVARTANYGVYVASASTSTTADTLYGIYSAPAKTGNTPSGTQTTYGSYLAPTSTGPSTASTATTNVYGQYISNTATHAADVGTVNSYGLYVANGTSSTNGTSTKYGIYIAPQTGADTDKNFNFLSTISSTQTTYSSTNTLDIPIAMQNTSNTDNNMSILSFINSNLFGIAHVGAINVSQVNNSGSLFFATKPASAALVQRMLIDPDGNVGIGDLTPNALLDLDAATTTTAAFGLTDTGVHTGVGTSSVAQITANSATTGDILTISATALTTGTALVITGGSTTPNADAVVKVTSDIDNTGSMMLLSPDFSNVDGGSTSYGIQIAATNSTAATATNYAQYNVLTLTGNAAKTGYGIYSTVTSSSTVADTLYGGYFATSATGAVARTANYGVYVASASTSTTADTLYGIYSAPAKTGNTPSGTQTTYGSYLAPTSTGPSTASTATTNVYGQYISNTATHAADVGTVNSYGLYVADGTSSTNGTSTKYGLYVADQSGADTNYEAIIAGTSGVGIGSTTPSGELHVSSTDTANSFRGIITAQYNTGVQASVLTLRKARGTEASPLTVADGDNIGNIQFNAYGTAYTNRAQIIATVNGTVSSDSVPTDLRFLTGLTSTTEYMRITSGGNVGIGDTSPDALFDIDAATTTTAAFGITDTGVHTGTGTSAVATIVANSATTGDIISVSATAMTTGEALDITGTWAPTNASTNEAIDINITHTSATLADNFQAINLTTTDGTALANTVYGISNTLTLTGNAAKTAYGVYSSVSSSSTTGEGNGPFLADFFSNGSITGALAAAQTRDAFGFKTTITSTAATAASDATLQLSGLNSQPSATGATAGTTNVYGLYTSTTATHAADAGTVNNYGVYVANGTSSTNGISTKYGLYVAAQTLADANYEAVFVGTNNIGFGTAAPIAPIHFISTATGDKFVTFGVDDGASTDGLNLGYGGASFGAGKSFLNAHSATAGNATFQMLINGTAGLTLNNDLSITVGLFPSAGTAALCWDNAGASIVNDCSGNPVADYAEIYSVKSDVEYGEIVATSDILVDSNYVATDENGNLLPGEERQIAQLKKSNQPYQQDILGVTSQNWSDFASTGHGSIKEEDNPMPVALNGRVPVKVNTENGPIRQGDSITSSSVPGVGMKATGAGRVIGMALEDYNGGSTGKIVVFVNPTYYYGENLAHEITNPTMTPQPFYNTDGSVKDQYKGQVLTSEQVDKMIKQNNPGSLSGVFSVDSNNNVGLGIASPSAKFDVAGVIKSGVEGEVAGAVTVAGQDSGSTTIKASSSGDTWTMTLPTSAGVAGQLLTTDGNGNTSWVSIDTLTTPLRDEIFAVVGEDTDPSSENTIFGKLAKIETEDIADINSKLSVFSVATESVTIVRDLVVDARATFNNTVEVLQDIVLSGRIKHKDQDTAGFAVIKAGTTDVAVTFDRPYEVTPVINITSNSSSSSAAFVKDVTTNGFTVSIDSTASADFKYSWNALLIESPKIFESTGSAGSPQEPSATPTP